MPFTLLREEREKKGLTLEDVSNELKIGKVYLHYIETGDFDSLPQPVFSKGYIRSYSAFLNVDSREILESYNEYLSQKEPLKLNTVKEISDLSIKNRKWRRLAVLVLSVVCIFALSVHFLGRQIRKEKEKLEEKVKLQEDLGHNASDIEITKKTRTESDEKNNLPAEKVGVKKEAFTREVKGKVTDGLILNLKATELTWLYVIPDNGELVDVTLYPGDSLKVTAREKIKLKLGNAGGVVATLNGKELGQMGGSGEVVEKILQKGGGE